ncbi:MAG: glycosyltransferase family 4 protein [Desulfomonilaceae bacterium]
MQRTSTNERADPEIHRNSQGNLVDDRRFEPSHLTHLGVGSHQPIRVLHVINWFRQGGLETQVLRILRCYDRRRFRMDACVIGPEAGYLAEEARSYGAEILFCPKSPNLFSFSRLFSQLLKNKAYDVVHSHGEAWSGATLRGAAQAGVPVRIAHMRDMGHVGAEADKNALIKAARVVVTGWGRYWVRRHATHVVAVSQAALNERWPEWTTRSDRFFVWTGGVDIQRFSAIPNGKSSATPPVIICVGNFFLRSKRQDMAVRVLVAVRNAIPEARLVFVGTGTHESGCRDLARSLGVSDAVDFLGPRDRTEIPALLGSARVFLYCSESEGLPNVLLEAQATGLPVVATDIPAHREVLSPAFHPYLFNHGELDKAANKVTEILTQPNLAKNLGEAGRAYVSEHYSASSYLKILEDYYLSWLSSGKGRQ